MTVRHTGGRSVRHDEVGKMAPDPISDRVRAMSDAEIARQVADDPDGVDTSAPGFWDKAKVVLPETKTQVTLRVDQDVLRWFRARGKGYQTLMNAVLRSYVEAHRRD